MHPHCPCPSSPPCTTIESLARINIEYSCGESRRKWPTQFAGWRQRRRRSSTRRHHTARGLIRWSWREVRAEIGRWVGRLYAHSMRLRVLSRASAYVRAYIFAQATVQETTKPSLIRVLIAAVVGVVVGVAVVVVASVRRAKHFRAGRLQLEYFRRNAYAHACSYVHAHNHEYAWSRTHTFSFAFDCAYVGACVRDGPERGTGWSGLGFLQTTHWLEYMIFWCDVNGERGGHGGGGWCGIKSAETENLPDMRERVCICDSGDWMVEMDSFELHSLAVYNMYSTRV